MTGKRKTWRDWFKADGTYLGQRSARTGPDLRTAQPCGCEVCENGRRDE